MLDFDDAAERPAGYTIIALLVLWGILPLLLGAGVWHEEAHVRLLLQILTYVWFLDGIWDECDSVVTAADELTNVVEAEGLKPIVST